MDEKQYKILCTMFLLKQIDNHLRKHERMVYEAKRRGVWIEHPKVEY